MKAAAVAASGPLCWTLKGEGNANIVLSYVGTDQLLVSQTAKQQQHATTH